MGTIDIDYGSLGVGLLLMLIPVYFLWRFKTGLLKPVLIGTVRMIIQLFLIGAYLRFLFEWNNPFINFLWVIIMVGVAGRSRKGRGDTGREETLCYQCQEADYDLDGY